MLWSISVKDKKEWSALAAKYSFHRRFRRTKEIAKAENPLIFISFCNFLSLSGTIGENVI